MLLSVVIPVYNRKQNLEVCLAGLLAQRDAPPFEVIIVDDGSTDGLREFVQGEFGSPPWPLRYLSGGPNKGFRGGRARNLGSFNAEGTRLLFIDSDVVLNQDALAAYGRAGAAQPEAIIVGPYHWLPPLDWSERQTWHLLWEASGFESLLRAVLAAGVPHLPEDNDSPFGLDVRHADFGNDLGAVREGAGLGGLSGNISYPRELFWELGGFDERVVGHGGEDADLGLTADEFKTSWLFYAPCYGFHLWHPRDQVRNSREVQANIAFIDRKHGVGQYAGAQKWTDSQDWSDPIHYHKHLGARLLKVPFQPQVYVYRPDTNRYLKLASPRWLVKLGFTWADLEETAPEFIEQAHHSGDAVEPADQALAQVAQQAGLLPELRQAAEAALNPLEAAAPPPANGEARKFGLKDFRADRGASLQRSAEDPTVFAVREGQRLGINHPDWITWLGFNTEQILVVPAGLLAGYADAGATPEPVKIWTGEADRLG